jgi:hypothetical protein
MAKGNSLSPVVNNIFVEQFEEIVLDTADHKLVMVWPHGAARLQQFLHHPNSIRPTIKFTMEVEANHTLPFLDILVMKWGKKLATLSVPETYSCWLLPALQVQPPTSCRGGGVVIHSSVSRAKVICQDHKN